MCSATVRVASMRTSRPILESGKDFFLLVTWKPRCLGNTHEMTVIPKNESIFDKLTPSTCVTKMRPVMKHIYVVFDTSAIFSGKKASAARFSQKVTKFLQNRGLLVSSRKYFVNLLINISEIFSGNVQVLDPKILVCKIFIFVNTHFFFGS